MAISLKNIYEDTKEKYKLQLLAGKEGVDNVVNWVHFMEDSKTIDFIRGSELIITTGLGCNNENWLYNLIEGLIHRNACGLIVNTGMYIKGISQSVVDYCNEKNFPLFTMPWEIHLVDIMQDYCNKIVVSEQSEISASVAFFNAIFSKENKEGYEVYLEQNGYDLKGSYLCIILSLDKEDIFKEGEYLLKKIKISLRNSLNPFSMKYSIIVQNQDIILVFHRVNKKDINIYGKRVYEVFKKEYSLYSITIGVGSIILGVDNIYKSFNHASSAIKIAKSNNKNIEYYEEIGINKIILEVKDEEVLRDVYRQYLGKLEDYDKAHKTDYMNILRLYIKYNGSIKEVGERTFNHRNTINYRIKKIKTIIDSDISTMDEKFCYQLAFYIRDIIGN